jgi:CBS-domain-containing membrane protein/PII-like signaling protein
VQPMARGARVQVFLGEDDLLEGRPRHELVLEYLRREGAAGATIIRGSAGFGDNSRVKSASVLRFSSDLPVILVWVDAPERVERLLPGVVELAGAGVVTVDDVQIAGYGGRSLEQLRFDLPVHDVMRRNVVSIPATATVRDAVSAIVGQVFRALPVIDHDGRLVGIVANTDLLERGGLTVRLELLSAMPEAERADVIASLPEMPVEQVMRRDPVTLRPDETLADATRRMSETRLKRLPVVDADGRLVGILSRSDVLRAVGESFPLNPGAGAHPGARTAGELMRPDAPVVNLDAPLDAVLAAVVSTRLNRAVVVDDARRVVGVVSDEDLLALVQPAQQAGVVGALMRSSGATGGGQRAAEVMRADAPTVTASTPLAAAAEVMVAQRRKMLPVTDDEGHLLGILDRADLLHATSGALADLAGTEAAGDGD